MGNLFYSVLALFLLSGTCDSDRIEPGVVTGAERLVSDTGFLENRKVGLVVNHTSLIGDINLVDTLLSLGVDVERIFSPEHGFRGVADAGKIIESGADSTAGIGIVSLYGVNRKPARSDLEGLDIILFDIQDVGARFYTYISTLQYVMEVAGSMQIPVVVLDRPNPNGHYVDGPVLKSGFSSFVGLQPIPVVHGMTIGEYALMINGEGWLPDSIKCDLEVIGCLNYNHSTEYILPVPPSPNLPNQNSVYLYPSICFLREQFFRLEEEQNTRFSNLVTRIFPPGGFSFVPEPTTGAADPKLNGIICYGKDLSGELESGRLPSVSINLQWLLDTYRDFPDKEHFFTSYFNTLAGNADLKQQIIDGLTQEQIRASWKEELVKFRVIREKYLLYPDFE